MNQSDSLTLPTMLTEQQVAQITAMSLGTLRRWRLLRQGPPFCKLGSSAVRYDADQLREWLASRSTGGPTPSTPAPSPLASSVCTDNRQANPRARKPGIRNA